MSWGRAWMTDSVADERIASVRKVGLPDDGDVVLEEHRVKAVQAMLDSGDLEARDRALTHIERMTDVRQKVRQDTLKHAEAAMDIEAATTLVRQDDVEPAGTRTPEQVTADLDVFRRSMKKQESDGD